jgi:hypothetical protein
MQAKVHSFIQGLKQYRTPFWEGIRNALVALQNINTGQTSPIVAHLTEVTPHNTCDVTGLSHSTHRV